MFNLKIQAKSMYGSGKVTSQANYTVYLCGKTK